MRQPRNVLPLLLSHPTGNNFVRALLAELQARRQLAAFHTTVAASPSDWILSLMPPALRREWLRRAYDLPRDRVVTRPWRELVRVVAGKLGWHWLTAHETGWACIDAVYRDCDRAVARALRQPGGAAGLSGVYAYEDGAWHTFRVAHLLGLGCFYDLPIGYWRAGRAIQQEEAEVNPAWAPTLIATRDSAAKLARKDEELALSDIVFVASSFTRQTLDLAPQRPPRIAIAPYGAPSTFYPVDPAKFATQRPLNVLFVGRMEQRKGVSYLLDAVAQLGDRVTLTLIGQPVGMCPPLARALQTYRWIPSLPHPQLLAAIAQHDVLVFPSLFEGFGQVILEAMAQGVPAIATPHTAAPDIITQGVDGIIVPIRNPEAIAEALDWMARDRDCLATMASAAQQRARAFTWPVYAAAIADEIARFLEV